MALAMSSATNRRFEFDNPALNAETGKEAPEKTLPNLAQIAPSQEPGSIVPGLNEKIFPINFDFTWENSAFVAQLTKDTNSKDILATISADIGWLPFTAENREMRDHALDFFKQHAGGISGNFKVAITGRVTFTQKTRLGDLGSRTDIVSTLSLCLLQARPYLKMVQCILR